MAEIALSHGRLLKEIQQTETFRGAGAFWWLGQHTFIVKAMGYVIYIDPWFAPHEQRQTPPLLTPDEGESAHFVLVTHGHGDHLCLATLAGIRDASPQAIFICPHTEKTSLVERAQIPPERVRTIDANCKLRVPGRPGITVHAIKAKHEEFHEHPELGFPYLGYVVNVNGITFYHAGDTILYEGLLTSLREFDRIDVAFLPINGRDPARYRRGCMGNFTYQEAVEVAGELGVGLAVPSHYDMFTDNQEDPTLFQDYLTLRYPGIPCWFGRAGERVTFSRNAAS